MTSVKNDTDMLMLGKHLGERLRGGEMIELIGDVGAGKTTLVKGVGQGLKIHDDVQSPSFTISRVYTARDELELHHYDFYRLQEAGVMSFELAESIDEPRAVTIVEWADTVLDVLPMDRMIVKIDHTPYGNGRIVTVSVPETLQYLKGVL